MVAVTGFSFSGQGQNMGLAFIPLKPWDQRKGKGQGAQDLATRITMHMGALRDSFIFVVSPPPIPELGRGTGFSFRLQDRGGLGHADAPARVHEEPERERVPVLQEGLPGAVYEDLHSPSTAWHWSYAAERIEPSGRRWRSISLSM